MFQHTHSGQPLRHFLWRRVGALVATTALLVAASFVWFGVLPMASQVADDQFDVAVVRVQAALDAAFLPPQRLLAMSPSWLHQQAPDLADPTAFNHIFKPVLTELAQVTSVVAGSATGQGWLLLQKPGGGWRNRMTDVPRWGDQHHVLIDHHANGQAVTSLSTAAYDPRLRLWFTGAMASPDQVHWTAPYTFFTTGDPGITASKRMRLADGQDLVLGFDVTLRDVSRITMQAKVGQHGQVLVLTADERVLSLPQAPAGVAADSWLARVLQPVEALDMPAVTAAMRHWRAQQRPLGDVFGIHAAGAPWLASVHAYRLGQQQFWVLVLAPAADFAPAWLHMAAALGAALAVVLALALWITRAGSTRLAQPLEQLADHSRRIGLLDFTPQPAVHSRVAEIQQLAHTQSQTLETLRLNQDTLDAQADALSHQVAALKATEARLQQHNQTLQTVIDNFPGGVSVVNAALRLVAYNQQFQTLLELPDSLLMQPDGVGFEDIIRFNASRGDYGPADVEPLVAERVALAKQFLPHRQERTLPNGRTLEVRGTPLPQGGFVSLYVDVTANKQHEQALEHLAHFDALTSLPNRVLLADRLRQGMSQVGRRSQQLAVVFLDLDGFKRINDTHGHEVGDQLLLALSARMRAALRDGDTLARIGGDEFVAVLMDVAGLADSVPMLQRLLQAASEPLTVAGYDVAVSASLGVTFYPQAQEVDADQLIRQADQAMYQAKQAGKNRYHLFDAEQDRSQRGQFESLTRIATALEQSEFVLYYQPKVNMRLGHVVGAEALIRWQHPQQGLLAPAHFLPLIEDHPLSVEVGEWVVRTALAQLAAWHVQGLQLAVSVNVGARQLQQPGFVAFMRAALAEQPTVKPASLQIEVLETSALQDMARVTEVMLQCRQLGLTFALDDFGTGYSSLTYLKRLPVKQLKIDQSFVRDMLDDPDDLSILLGVLDLAASFHRQAIAEGVETVAHGHMLLQLGCEKAQGYGIARPMPAADLPGWAAAWQPDASWQTARVVSRSQLPLLFAQVEHRAWVQAVQSYVAGECKVRPELDVHQCHLGKWLDAGEWMSFPNRTAGEDVLALHQQAHVQAEHVCFLKSRSRDTAALAQLPKLLALRDQLLARLQAMV